MFSMCTVESHNKIAHSECLKYSEANYTQVHYTVKVTGNIKITIKYYTIQVTNLRRPSDYTILKLQSSTSYTCSASNKFKEIQVTPRIISILNSTRL